MEKRALASQRGGGVRKGREGGGGGKTKPGSLVERTAKCPKVGDRPIIGFLDEIH